jgi:hypothetical protein
MFGLYYTLGIDFMTLGRRHRLADGFIFGLYSNLGKPGIDTVVLDGGVEYYSMKFMRMQYSQYSNLQNIRFTNLLLMVSSI